MTNALQRTGPVVEIFEVEGTRERRVVIAYKQGTVKSFFSAMSNLYHFYVGRFLYTGACIVLNYLILVI